MFRGAVPKLSLDEFLFCLQLASGVVQGKVPMTPPSKRGSIELIDEETGAVDTITFTDVPENFILAAIRDAMGDKFPQAMWRFWMLTRAMGEPRIRAEFQSPDDPELISISLIEACAVFPASYSRAPRDFEKRIIKLARKIQAREEDSIDG